MNKYNFFSCISDPKVTAVTAVTAKVKAKYDKLKE
jgi:hypothetical protein